MSAELPTIADVVHAHLADGSSPETLITRLVNREQDRVEKLAEVAILQFGVHPEFYAEVMAVLEMGAPIEPEVRALIHEGFVNHIEELRRQYGENGDPA